MSLTGPGSGSSVGFTNSSGSSGWMMSGGASFGSSNNGFSGWSDEPQVPDSVVGFQVPLQELKLKLLEEKDQIVVLSAPAGCGKTTLAAMLLSEKDAKALFCTSAFKDSIPNVRLDLVHKVVRSCGGFPLALRVVGRSLCGQPEGIWYDRVMMQCERQILFPTENDLLRSLQASINALDEKVLYSRDRTTLRDCYLDLGSFPEDHRIHPDALLDMWVERYNLDEDGMTAMAIFFELSSQNLVNLALARKDAPAVVGLHNLHYIQQHDMLREVVIHQCDETPVEERMRKYINVKGNDFPRWWFEQRLQPLQAEVLSIITEQMSQLKTLIVTNNGFVPAKLNNFQLCSLLNIKRINLERISVTSIFTANLQLPNLHKISLIMCEIGEAFENSAANMPYMWPKLVEMNIEYCNDLLEVPAEICDLVDLKRLSICHCHELVSLPEELGRLTNLEVLRLHSCTKLAELPESIVKLNKLGFLDVYDCVDMGCLPMQMDQLCSLRTVCMGNRLGFTELPNSVLKLVQLEDVV
ncbi:hypothetical protein RND71_011503 [Anisodus tanguticus]|uniref:Disease resistance R13L4/SHOC-2-like LRR domain-containing protein n=1 Tax=Anisodus tanguticus TaxID=243964 RepID=A0AAE1SDI4_9SOLA|nr:hypothetical protein RND71_011503 [Anisodus tanguticus]